MAYEPTVWKTGDIVSSEKLNKLENGVANSGDGDAPFIVWIGESSTFNEYLLKRAGNIVYDDTDSNFIGDNVANGTQAQMFRAIKDAILSGKRIMFGPSTTYLSSVSYAFTQNNYAGAEQIDMYSLKSFYTQSDTPTAVIGAAYIITKRDSENTVSVEAVCRPNAAIYSATLETAN